MQKELDALVREVLPLDRSAMTAAEEYQARLAKPPGSLGRLEEISIQLAGITGRVHNALNKKQLLVFAADNGVVAEGVSSAPQSVTKQQTINLMRGKTGAAVLAKHFGCGLTVCDVGVNADIYESTVLNRKIAYGTQNICTGPAMTREQTLQAILTGAEIARTVDADVIGVGEMGIGNTTTSSAVLAVLLLRSLGVFGTPSAVETTPTPAPTVPVETAVPTETPTPTPTPKPEPTYEVVKADVSWADAEAAAEAKGGHLVVIDSAEKWTRVAQLADESGLTYVWIGLYRADSGELAWVKDNIDPVYNWAAGEPSVRDTNGAAENYVLIARRSDGWYYNDCIGDPAAKYPQFYGGKTGYIIEIDP